MIQLVIVNGINGKVPLVGSCIPDNTFISVDLPGHFLLVMHVFHQDKPLN